jgi:FHS family L-fucose permease-like MFS transporter
MLTSLFIVALGFALQQIVANPYVIALGTPETGSHRVNLAGGINSLGTTIGPLIIAYALFGDINAKAHVSDISFVKTPYTVLALAFLVFALFLGFSKLPPIKNTEKIEKDFGALKFPQLILGMIAIFVYVGVEVTTQSNLPALIKEPTILGLNTDKSVHFISMYWGCLMVGRWIGALNVFNLTNVQQKWATVFVPFFVFAIIMGVNFLKGSPMADFIYFIPFIFIVIAAFFITQAHPVKTMIVFGLAALIMLLCGILFNGRIAVYFFISVGLFCSVMWPCIFNLSIAGLGKYTNQGSALLIMMIIGGAIIPSLQGFVGDKIGIQLSYIVPAIGFAYLALYGYWVNKILKKQGINFNLNTMLNH